MLHHLARLMICVLCIVVASAAVLAQPDPFSIGVSFDASGTQFIGDIPAFAEPTRLYFLMFNLGESIVSYENSVSISGLDSGSWIVTRGTPEGLDVDPSADGYVVGLSACAGTPGATYVMNTYDFAWTASLQSPTNTLVCAQPATYGAASIPGYPSYQTCAGALGASGVYPEALIPEVPAGCAIINCWYGVNSYCTVPTESTSWGALKAHF